MIKSLASLTYKERLDKLNSTVLNKQLSCHQGCESGPGTPGPEKTTRSRVSNYPKATPASASPLRNDRTAGTAWTVQSLQCTKRDRCDGLTSTVSLSAPPTVAHIRRWADISHITSQTMCWAESITQVGDQSLVTCVRCCSMAFAVDIM